MTQPSGSSDFETIKQLLFGGEVSRLEQALASDRQQAAARAGEFEQKVDRAFTALEQRVDKRLDEMNQRVTAQLEDLARKQQAHADKVTQLLDQVMAELARRTDALTADTRAGFEELRARAGELERRKLNVSDFGSSLAALGQRFAGSSGDDASRG